LKVFEGIASEVISVERLLAASLTRASKMRSVLTCQGERQQAASLLKTQETLMAIYLVCTYPDKKLLL
jgi:hypothetical protein